MKNKHYLYYFSDGYSSTFEGVATFPANATIEQVDKFFISYTQKKVKERFPIAKEAVWENIKTKLTLRDYLKEGVDSGYYEIEEIQVSSSFLDSCQDSQ